MIGQEKEVVIQLLITCHMQDNDMVRPDEVMTSNLGTCVNVTPTIHHTTALEEIFPTSHTPHSYLNIYINATRIECSTVLRANDAFKSKVCCATQEKSLYIIIVYSIHTYYYANILYIQGRRQLKPPKIFGISMYIIN